MYLTQYTDYSLRVLIFASIHKERLINITEIAQAYQISHSHLMKVAAALVRGGFLHSVRGKNGGLYLAAQPRDIAIGAVVRHMEPMQIVECMGPDNRCCIAPNCQLAGILSGAANAFLDHLDGYTLADLLHHDTIGQLYRPPEEGDKPIPSASIATNV
ncbi:Rrf2 family nitric oxide-sensitive transcriptional repressor [Neisseria sp. HSC-16F19]|nr:Rrf2 family transcriptional regulator [Neisseria sp. HSC-16F19]MCP2039693.1 Rrf2 family nitric oxide-sensitive transcriptional repressor [Neisseria sp. HSC-16F19]